jgi:hypothetical protein
MSNKSHYYNNIDNINFIKKKREQLSSLRSSTYKIKSDTNQLSKMSIFLYKNKTESIENLKKTLTTKINELQNILNIMNNHKDVVTTDDLEKKIIGIPKYGAIINQISILETEIKNMEKLFDICPTCDGKTTIYDSEEASGDPYARSSDYRKDCPTCKTTGRHPENLLNKI